jgi:hypothetical protein
LTSESFVIFRFGKKNCGQKECVACASIQSLRPLQENRQNVAVSNKLFETFLGQKSGLSGLPGAVSVSRGQKAQDLSVTGSQELAK